MVITDDGKLDASFDNQRAVRGAPPEDRNSVAAAQCNSFLIPSASLFITDNLATGGVVNVSLNGNRELSTLKLSQM